MTEPQKIALREELLELAKGCPVDSGNPPDCVLHHIRNMDPAKRAEWVKSLSADCLSLMVFYHHTCRDSKLRAKQYHMEHPWSDPDPRAINDAPSSMSHEDGTTLVDW